MHPDLARRIAAWLAAKDAAHETLLFPVSERSGGIERKTALMMRVDLKAARTLWLDEAADDRVRAEREKSDFLLYKNHQNRYADFHANRNTFIRNLSKVGVSAKTPQTLARHSDIRLTMHTYSHTELAEQQAAIEKVSGLVQRYGSAPDARNGSGRHDVAGEKRAAPREPEAAHSAETVVPSEVGTRRHDLTPEGENALGGIRTPNPRFRRPMLYPIELRVRVRRILFHAHIQDGRWHRGRCEFCARSPE